MSTHGVIVLRSLRFLHESNVRALHPTRSRDLSHLQFCCVMSGRKSRGTAASLQASRDAVQRNCDVNKVNRDASSVPSRQQRRDGRKSRAAQGYKHSPVLSTPCGSNKLARVPPGTANDRASTLPARRSAMWYRLHLARFCLFPTHSHRRVTDAPAGAPVTPLSSAGSRPSRGAAGLAAATLTVVAATAAAAGAATVLEAGAYAA